MVWQFFVWIIIQTGVVFPASTGDIVITEFFYNASPGSDLPEYVELFNTTESSIDLNGWKVQIDDYLVVIDVSFSIDSLDYAVILNTDRMLRSDDGTNDGINYCSIVNNFDPTGLCDSTINNLYFRIGTFSDLSNDSGRIKIWDDSDSTIVIDAVAYSAPSFPVGEEISGKAAVFIIDPRPDSTHVKNDDGLNWRSSEHPSKYLWNSSSSDFGSPLSSNFITPTIFIEAITNLAGDSTIDVSNRDSTIFRPPSDGIPGGYAAIQLTGSAINVDSADVTLDFLYWEIKKNILSSEIDSLWDSSSEIDSIWWHPDSLLQDTNSLYSVYTIPLFTRDTCGFMGKTDTIIYINREFNFPPVVDSINGLVGGTIEIFDDDSLLLYGFVTDTELCPSLETSCTSKNLYFPVLDPPVYKNDSPFLWSSESLDKLDSIHTLETVFRPDSIISLGDISANSIRDTLEFQLKATDPFGATGTNSVTVIVHNKNQKPIITLDSTNINAIDIVAGYSNKFIVNGNQIELNEYDASGVQTDTTIIAEITDIDNDLNFTVTPLGSSCDDGFEHNYCVSGTTIKTAHKVSYDSLMIPFMVDDGVPSPIAGFNSESTSDISYLVIQNIKKVTNTVTFDNPVIAINDTFHLPEDSTLTTEISFYIEFKLDSIQTYNVNLDSLNWSFDKLDSEGEGEQRVFAYKSGDAFKIDSLSNNFNGLTGLKVSVADFDNAANSLVDSIIINIPIYIDQRNDTLKHFKLHHDIKNYSIDESTIDSIRGVRYFRLAQFSSDNNASNPTPEKLRFEWEKNDDLDIDTKFDINQDTLQDIFYRLELIDTLTNVVSILKDSLQHNNFLEFENIWAEIDFLEDEFPFYYDSLGYKPPLGNQTIDINGLSTYRWRVVAKNYWQDDLGKDPVGISQEWNMTDFKIDLLQPEVIKLDIILNDMYPGYYDLLWNSSEAFLTDSTFLSIREKTNQISAISMLNPRKITDNLFHFTGLIPTNLTSAIIAFDLRIRDNAMNSGVRQDTVSYIKVSPDTASLLISPSNNVTISLPQFSISEPVHIIITEENSNIASRESYSELYQITPTIHFYPKDLSLNKPGSIQFDVSNYLSTEMELWKLVIVKINETESISLPTIISGETLNANIDKLGSYAVFMNLTLERPIPSKFELKMNYPNPFNPSTTIPIELPEESFVEVAIYNILGEKITVLSEGVKSSGYHNILWNGKNQFGKPVSSGIYFVSVHLGQKIYHQKMMLLK